MHIINIFACSFDWAFWIRIVIEIWIEQLNLHLLEFHYDIKTIPNYIYWTQKSSSLSVDMHMHICGCRCACTTNVHCASIRLISILFSMQWAIWCGIVCWFFILIYIWKCYCRCCGWWCWCWCWCWCWFQLYCFNIIG
jgi:hypothetical protein